MNGNYAVRKSLCYKGLAVRLRANIYKSIKTIDLRDERIVFLSAHLENEEYVNQIVFTDTTIILNDEQMERLRG
jgi:hypothetical protein